MTATSSARLFAVAAAPAALAALPEREIGRLIFPVGFYNTKARQLRDIGRVVGGRPRRAVPADLDALLTLNGVGRKTANLVLTLGFKAQGICVDTHVHRITNRWGYVRTKAPNDTEQALRKILPPRHWIEINDILVAFGQHLCRPISPHCSTCPLSSRCPRVGVLARPPPPTSPGRPSPRSVRSTSMILSMPFLPMMAGTPTKRPLTPYSPSSSAQTAGSSSCRR